MASSLSPLHVPRFLLPRQIPTLRHSHLTILSRGHAPATRKSSGQLPPPSRHASSGPSKPIVLEKPAKFSPPSHPQRIAKSLPKSYGPELSSKERERQKTKQYPHMMPPEGSSMHWFLTSRALHLWITFSVLGSLAFVSLLSEFKRTSAYAHLLPSFDDFSSRPFASLGQAFEVYKLHTNQKSEEAAERRKNKVEEARKRKKYRVAHGMEDLAKGLQMEDAPAAGAAGESVDGAVGALVGEGRAEYTDFEGRRKPIKKWLGIW